MARKFICTLALTVCGSLITAGVASADDVYLRSGANAAELPLKNVTVSRFKEGEVYYTIGAREAHRPISEIRLELTGETQFNAAEKAFAEARYTKDPAVAKAKFSEAVSGYDATLNSTNKPWLKDFTAQRMQIAAPRSGRFDVALRAWMTMVERDPAAAGKAKPSVEGIDPKSAYLVNGAKALTAAVNGTPKPDARRALLDLLGDVQSAMGDVEAVNKTREAQVMLGGSPEEIAVLQVKLAQSDVAGKKYDAALQRLAKIDLSALPDAARADATFLTAECQESKLTPAAPADEWKDLAIEYMKVVAGFPHSDQAGPALLKVAQIHETLKEPDTALKIYQQVAREHANTPAGQAAQRDMARLGKPTARN